MGILDLFKTDPEKKLRTLIAKKSEAAMQFQRNGKLREFGELSAEVAELEKELESLQAASAR